MANDETLEPAVERCHRIGSYRILRPLGEGGMGSVCLAFDERLERHVALKTIRDGRAQDGDARARFWREARAIAALKHPGIVEVYDLGEADGALYLAMEYIDGVPLSARMAVSWEPHRALEVVRQAAAALGVAHAQGLIHRDVKPSNLLLDAAGHVHVIDFGLARRAEGDDRITSTGAAIGTPAYMAPEQVNGDAVSPATDVFALCTTLYTLLAGVHPFQRECTGATAAAVAAGLHRPLDGVAPHLPRSVVALVEAGLAVDAAQRPATGAELAQRLARVAADLAPLAVPPASPLGRSVSLPEGVTGPTGLHVPRARRRALPMLALGLGVGVLVGIWALTRVAALPTAALNDRQEAAHVDPGHTGHSATAVGPTPAEATGTMAAPSTLPLLAELPRPVVAVLDLALRSTPGSHTPAGAGTSDAGAISSEVARYLLDTLPERLIVAPLDALEGNRHTASEPLRPAALTRPGRALGNVDVLVSGQVEAGAPPQLRVELATPGAGQPLRVVRLPLSANAARDGLAGAVDVGETLARGVAQALGVSLPTVAPGRVAEAWSAYRAARLAMLAGDDEKVPENLAWAFRLDPTLAPARALELQQLRAEGRLDDLVARAAALAGAAGVPERLRDYAAAAGAYGAGAHEDAVRRLEAHLLRWPLDLDARGLLVVVRFFSPAVLDLDEVERHARATLQIAPRNEDAASRLIRTLGFRGRGAEIAPMLAELGLPMDTARFKDIAAEAALLSGQPDAAQRFDEALSAEPGNSYAEHMGMAARILDGRCGEATQRALGRIARVETLGKDSNLDWTYSLAHQGLLCDARWDAASDLRARWSARSPSGAAQSVPVALRSLLAQGRPREQVVRPLEAQLALAAPGSAERAALLGTYARVANDPVALAREADAAERASVDLGSPNTLRRAYFHGARMLRAREQAAKGAEPSAVRAAADAAVLAWSDVRGEGDLATGVETRMLRAELLEGLGAHDEAQEAYRQIVALGYARLWVNDLVTLARARLHADLHDGLPDTCIYPTRDTPPE